MVIESHDSSAIQSCLQLVVAFAIDADSYTSNICVASISLVPSVKGDRLAAEHC